MPKYILKYIYIYRHPRIHIQSDQTPCTHGSFLHVQNIFKRSLSFLVSSSFRPFDRLFVHASHRVNHNSPTKASAVAAVALSICACSRSSLSFAKAFRYFEFPHGE